MIDAVVGNLENLSFIFGILVAIATLIFALNKLRVCIYVKVFKPLIIRFFDYSREREVGRVKRVFEELKPMIDAQVEFTLQEHKEVLHDQQVTLQSSISESVEFKSFVNKNMIALQQSIETLVIVVKKNSEDSERVRDCLDTIDRKIGPAYINSKSRGK